jgi:hypothetical protein
MPAVRVYRYPVEMSKIDTSLASTEMPTTAGRVAGRITWAISLMRAD